jgi:hypothetical protein
VAAFTQKKTRSRRERVPLYLLLSDNGFDRILRTLIGIE